MKKIKLSIIAFAELSNYVRKCFESEHFFQSHTLGSLVEFHLQEIWEKLHRKSLDIQYKDQKIVRLTFTQGEMITFSYMFAAVPCEGYMLTIQNKLLTGL